MKTTLAAVFAVACCCIAAAQAPPSSRAGGATAGQAWWEPYSPPCTAREDVFEFTRKPSVQVVGKDQYEITFAVEGYCDVTVGIIDEKGRVVRHLGSGVLGKNAPPPFQKDSLSQTLTWNGKDDLERYPKHPGKLHVRVRLGLKAEFDKRLGGTSPYNIPGFVLGIATDPDGAYVFTRGEGAHNQVHLRKFGHDGKYLATLAPPPANLPVEKLGGRTLIEFAPGRTTHHGPEIMRDMGYDGNVIPGLGHKSVADVQPVVVNGRIFFCNSGPGHRAGNEPSRLHHLYTDGSTDVKGLRGRPFFPWRPGGPSRGFEHLWPRFAASPDGKWLYMVGIKSRRGNAPAVLRCSADGDDPALPFIGKSSKKGKRVRFEPGSGNDGFNNPRGIDTDAAGRIYVADTYNNRIQVFSPASKYLKTIPIDRPELVCVHKQTGAIYVQHKGRVKGKSADRLSKLRSLDRPAEVFHRDGIRTSSMALDSWAPRPRIWIGGGIHRQGSTIVSLYRDRGPSVIVLEDTGNGFKELLDFDEQARKEAGPNYMGRWSGKVFDHVVCDPVREHAYYGIFRKNVHVFDLKTGRRIRVLRFPGAVNDIAFDRRGYLHCHLDPGFYMPGVGRLDPDQPSPYKGPVGRVHRGVTVYREVPYNYGIALGREHRRGWAGGIPVKDQPGAKYFQDGFGVDMQGNIAVQSNIYWVPKMEETGWSLAAAGRKRRDVTGELSGPSRYPDFLRAIKQMQKRGEQVYFIRRRPGTPLAGATVWTYESTGELREECAVIAGGTMAGVQIDEDGYIYFVVLKAKMVDGKPFLFGRGRNAGTDELISRYNRHPFTGTLVKGKPTKVRFLYKNARVPLDPVPDRPVDVVGCNPFGAPSLKGGAWIVGAEWTFAGASPLSAGGCTCPSMRFHLDWYKRTFLPEAYRHAIGVLDTAGNLIMHIGRYGNFDSASGPKSRIPVGGDGVGLTLPRFISGTDNYLCFDDWGERLVVLRLKYHAEQTARIPKP
ncbi:MAG: hypothetical protein R6V58_03605 [Planctomycetota bacterium]